MKSLIALLTIATLAFTGAARSAETTDVKAYELGTCVYDGNALFSKGRPVAVIYKDHEMRFCSDDCKKKFESDPEAGIEKYQSVMKTRIAGGGKGAH